MEEEAWKRGPGRGGKSTVATVAVDIPNDIPAGARAGSGTGAAPEDWIIEVVATGAGSMTTRQQGVRDACPLDRDGCP